MKYNSGFGCASCFWLALDIEKKWSIIKLSLYHIRPVWGRSTTTTIVGLFLLISYSTGFQHLLKCLILFCPFVKINTVIFDLISPITKSTTYRYTISRPMKARASECAHARARSHQKLNSNTAYNNNERKKKKFNAKSISYTHRCDRQVPPYCRIHLNNIAWEYHHVYPM